MKGFSTGALLWVFVLLNTALAVKKELFKRCDQSGFCHRNRHYAAEISKTSRSYYSIDEESLVFNQASVTGEIVKKLGDGNTVRLPLWIDILEMDNIRVRVDEDRSQVQWDNKLLRKDRYSESWKHVFQREPGLGSKYKISALQNGKFTITYGNKDQFEADVYTEDFKIVIKYHGAEQMVLNDRHFLNIEHYRKEEDNARNLLPEETDYNSFKDDFKDSKGDSIPFGPESVALDFSFKGFKHVYGIPEHADTLSLKDTSSDEPYRLYNVDIFEYETDSRLPMYGVIPFLIAHKPGLSAGVFWVNSADTYVDIKKTEQSNENVISSAKDTQTHWISENGVLDVVILISETPQRILENYASLTGTTQLPQLFSLGYHQCRWNYNDEEDVLTITENMDKYGFPYDVIWLDIEYTENKKYFTWKKELFPNPEGMLNKLDSTGRNLVAIIDPHLKTDYEVSSKVEEGKFSLKNSNGDSYHGHCWPGESIWIDTFDPAAIEYWKTLYTNESGFVGSATNLHIWNDMNEPSVFSGPETSSPKDLITYGDYEIRSDHNIYGLTFHEATYEAMKERFVNKRPFILTRAYFAGSQRTAAMWTGDNQATWEYLKISIPMVLTQNIMGMPFGGADVGGFFGNPSKELLTRWYQAGIWYPFFRAHAHIDSRRREPWIAGAPYTDYMRDAVKTRYQLLPLWYTKFYETSISGSPVVEPLFYRYPELESVFEVEDEFFLGDILVKPVTDENAETQEILLPDEEVYYDYFTFESIQGKGTHQVEAPLSKIPAYIRSGTIIPRKDRYRRSTKLMKYDPYTLVIALNSTGEAKGKLYIDDGETFDYEQGDFLYLSFQVKDGVIDSEVLDGNLEITNRLEKVIIVNSESTVAKVSQEGEEKEADVEKGPNHIIIKNPGVNMGKPWSIKF